jgi:tetratricopeptide (TPR) repeat protein
LTLFAERARAVRPDFILSDENVKTVSTICAYLDGLPLGIELIAARIRLMSPEVLLARLDSQFILSADGIRALSTRQKTLNNAIGWSYNLLSEDEQKLFAYLSVFSGGFTLDMAEVVFSSSFKEKSVSDLISLLLDKSLLQLVQNRIVLGEARYIMLVTIQEFARQCLRGSGEETEIYNRHLAYFLDLAQQAGKEIRGPNEVVWLRRLSTERDNLRSALSWAIEMVQTEMALQMVGHLSWFWFRRSDLSEGRQWLGQVAALPAAPQYPRLYSYALAQLAFHTWLQSGPKEARPFVEQALGIARAHDDKWNTAWALIVYGLVLIFERNFRTARSILEESRALFLEVHDEWGYATALLCLGTGANNQDDQVTALALFHQSLELFRKVGDLYFQGVSLRTISDIRVKQGDWLLGQALLREALTLVQQLDSKYEIGACLWNLGYAIQPTGNVVRAVHLYAAAKNVLESIGAWTQEQVSAFENDLVPCRAALSDTKFAAAMEQGRAMTMEQAIQYALKPSTS